MDRGTRRFRSLEHAGNATLNWREYTFTPSIGMQYKNSSSQFRGTGGLPRLFLGAKGSESP